MEGEDTKYGNEMGRLARRTGCLKDRLYGATLGVCPARGMEGVCTMDCSLYDGHRTGDRELSWQAMAR